jgi:transposase
MRKEPVVQAEHSTIYVGFDVHKVSINVAVIPPGSVKVQETWQVANERQSIRRLLKKLREFGDGPIVCCYEAGACGYALQRQVREAGVGCIVIAPSLVPIRPGEHVKNDKRDAKKLALHLRSGLLTEVHPPTSEDEAVRDLMRAREDAKQDETRCRHRLSKFLLRRGLEYQGGTAWTQRHHLWLRQLRIEDPTAQAVLDAYLLGLDQTSERLHGLDRQIEEVAAQPRYAQPVSWLRCLRGVDTTTAMTLLAELHDFRRFTSARHLMAYLGLTPSEYSSGDKSRRGSITKAGNSHVRRVLIEASWSYRHRPSVSGPLRKRREGQPAAVIALADRAQSRLHHKYWRMKEIHRKPHNVVTVAIARELVGFIWGILTLQLQQAA